MELVLIVTADAALPMRSVRVTATAADESVIASVSTNASGIGHHVQSSHASEPKQWLRGMNTPLLEYRLPPSETTCKTTADTVTKSGGVSRIIA